MLGRPSLLYIFSNVGESALKAPSAMSFTRRRGWSFGTRSPGVLRLKMLSCCFLCPRIIPSDAGKRSCPGAAVDPPTLLSQHPARRGLGGFATNHLMKTEGTYSENEGPLVSAASSHAVAAHWFVRAIGLVLAEPA